MPWQQLKMTLNAEQAEQTEAACLMSGCVAVSLADAGHAPVLEPAPGATPLWPRIRLTALFEADADMTAVITEIGRVLGTREGLDHEIEPLADRQWEREWLRDFRPMRFGKTLWVCPHGQSSGDAGAVELYLDPGLAFGTGHHATTAMCLEWLDARVRSESSVLDFGCGSGILAIASLLLGAARATATDIDAQALAATRANALANGVLNRLSVRPVEVLSQQQHDIVVANILAGTLSDLSERLAALTRVGGAIGLSGILAEQAAHIVRMYSQWFSLAEPVESGNWVFLSGRRR